MAVSPYTALPDAAFWKPGVVRANPFALEGLYTKKYPILPDTRIATAGSCFAQHINRFLRLNGFLILDVEPAPPHLDSGLHHSHGYSLYSARYGNIYTVRQLLQLAQEAAGERQPANFIWQTNNRYFDALRPAIQPEGFESADQVLEERSRHIACVRQLFEQLDLFIFTLGLTEMWVDPASGTVYPLAPGVVAGDFSHQPCRFENARYDDILSDFYEFQAVLGRIREQRPFCVLLTVSPVPLTATASGNHVLAATSYSKSVLRAAAGDLCTANTHIDYFPSYEIVTNPRLHASAYRENLRSVRDEAVDHVMRHFFAEHQPITPVDPAAQPGYLDEEVACEEALLDDFRRSHTLPSTGSSELAPVEKHEPPHIQFETVSDFLATQVIQPAIYTIRSACSIPTTSTALPLIFEVDGRCDSSPLVCRLHGSINAETVLLPRLDEKATVDHLAPDATTVTFCDPLLYSGKISAGWYTALESDPIALIAQCVRHIYGLLNPDRLLFVGGSMGGFSCLRLIKHFPEAIFFLWNSHTNILQYKPQHVGAWMSILGLEGDGSMEDRLAEHGIEYDICQPGFFDDFKGMIYHFQQANDWHIRLHLLPLLVSIAGSDMEHWNTEVKAMPSRFITDYFFLHVGNWRREHHKGWHIAPSPALIQEATKALVCQGSLEGIDLNSYNILI